MVHDPEVGGFPEDVECALQLGDPMLPLPGWRCGRHDVAFLGGGFGSHQFFYTQQGRLRSVVTRTDVCTGPGGFPESCESYYGRALSCLEPDCLLVDDGSGVALCE